MVERLATPHLNAHAGVVHLGHRLAPGGGGRRHRGGLAGTGAEVEGLQHGQHHRGLRPSRAPHGQRGGGTGHVQLLHHDAGSGSTHGRGQPGRAHPSQRSRSVPSRANRDRGPLGPHAHHVLPREQHAHGPAVVVRQPAGGGGDGGVGLASEGPAVGQRGGGSATGLAPGGVGL